MTVRELKKVLSQHDENIEVKLGGFPIITIDLVPAEVADPEYLDLVGA